MDKKFSSASELIEDMERFFSDDIDIEEFNGLKDCWSVDMFNTDSKVHLRLFYHKSGNCMLVCTKRERWQSSPSDLVLLMLDHVSSHFGMKIKETRPMHSIKDQYPRLTAGIGEKVWVFSLVIKSEIWPEDLFK